jgi:hypothetical protein
MGLGCRGDSAWGAYKDVRRAGLAQMKRWARSKPFNFGSYNCGIGRRDDQGCSTRCLSCCTPWRTPFSI